MHTLRYTLWCTPLVYTLWCTPLVYTLWRSSRLSYGGAQDCPMAELKIVTCARDATCARGMSHAREGYSRVSEVTPEESDDAQTPLQNPIKLARMRGLYPGYTRVGIPWWVYPSQYTSLGTPLSCTAGLHPVPLVYVAVQDGRREGPGL